MKLTVLATILTVGLGTACATTTDSLQLSAGGLTATIGDNGTCVGTGCATLSNDINLAAGTDTIAGTIGGWSVNIISGTSFSGNWW